MFILHIDFKVAFNPLQSEHGSGSGFVFTRSIELPFVPFNDLILFVRGWDNIDAPRGFPLKDVTWDAD